MLAILPVRAAFANARACETTLPADFRAASAAPSVSLQACSKLTTAHASQDGPDHHMVDASDLSDNVGSPRGAHEACALWRFSSAHDRLDAAGYRLSRPSGRAESMISMQRWNNIGTRSQGRRADGRPYVCRRREAMYPAEHGPWARAFTTKHRPARAGRIPRTGESLRYRPRPRRRSSGQGAQGRGERHLRSGPAAHVAGVYGKGYPRWAAGVSSRGSGGNYVRDTPASAGVGLNSLAFRLRRK